MNRFNPLAGTFFRKVRENEVSIIMSVALYIIRAFAARVGIASLPCFALITGIHAADLSFQPGISNGMVFQRGKPIPLSGSGTPDSTLTLTFASQTRSAKTDSTGHWSLTLPAMDAGGPYTLTASENGKSAKVEDVLVGDVWVCSGQSNMQMGLAETIGGHEAIAALSRRATIRFLEVPRGAADSPPPAIKAEWKRGTPETLARFSAVGGYFAEHLHRDPSPADIPLGIINSSFGGTSIEAWSPTASLADIPQDQLCGSMFGIKPGTLFNQMIHPLFASPVKGVIWYQGEANAGQPALYPRLLRNLMDQWRKGWNQPDLPFLIVQLPAFDGKMGGLDFGWLREAQDQACLGFPHAWSIPTYDTTDGLDLHPKEKHDIGKRLALVAKREVYGLDVPAHGPRVEKTETSGRQLIASFDQNLKVTNGKNVLGFAIAGDDGEYRFATATLDGRKAVLAADGVPAPKTARYAWGGLTDANLLNHDGLPAFPFRTDKLPPESVQFQALPVFHTIDTPVYQLETGATGRIASLIVRGKQFLSNEPGGGTRIPAGFGARNLAHATVSGPRRLTLSDGSATLEVACRADGMTWTLTNRGTEAIELHIALVSDVDVRSQGNSATLTRAPARIRIDGLERVEDHRLVAKAPANASCELRFSIENP